MLLVAIIFSLEANLFAQKFPIADFLGTNIRREDPMKPLKTFGFVREYHDWVIDQGDKYASTFNAPGGTSSLVYPDNFFRWNPPYQGQTWEKFTPFYQSITANLQETSTTTKPICSSLKSCLPNLSGTGGFSNQSSTFSPVTKPYWGIASEFKPVKTNRSNITTHPEGTWDLFINPITVPPTTDNLAFIDNPLIPASYLWYADWVTQFSKAFATDNTGNLTGYKNAKDPFAQNPASIPDFTPETPAGQNLVGYVEIWNEQDKNWFEGSFKKKLPNPISGQPDITVQLPHMTQFTAEEYAAMAGMAYDGFSEGTFIKGQKPGNMVIDYDLGFGKTVKNTSKYVFGGLFDIGDDQWNYVANVNNVCKGLAPFASSTARRSGYSGGMLTNPTVKFPFDVLNFHHYCDNNVKKLGTAGTAPELDEVGEPGTTKTFKKRLREIRSNVLATFPNNSGGTDKELWLSEFGWDTNLESDQRCEQAGLTQEETQARWMNRIYLEIAAAKWDRAMQFCVRDEMTAATGFGSIENARYKSSGVVRDRLNNYAPKMSYWYISTLQNTLKNYFFAQELQCFNHTLTNNAFTFTDAWQYNTPVGTPRIYLFKNAITNLGDGINPPYPNIESATAKKDILAVWLPTVNNGSLSNYKIYFQNFDGTAATSVTLVTPVQGDENGVKTLLTIQKDVARDRYFVTVPLINEIPRYIILGANEADTNLPTCPTVVATDLVPVSCDAISLKWTNASTYDKISIYYYEGKYGETQPTFDLSNPKWRLYTDNLPGTFVAGTQSQTVIAGLKQMTGNCFVVLIPTKDNKIPATLCVHSVKTGACFGGIPIADITVSANGNSTIANKLFDYDTKNYCYPQQTVITGGWDDFSTTLDINLVTSTSANFYTIHTVSIYDQNGTDLIEIRGDNDFNDGNGTTLLATYQSRAREEWVSIPLIAGNWKRLKLVRPNTFPVIQRLVLYGYKLNPAMPDPANDKYKEPACCGSANAIQVGSGATSPKATASLAFGANTNQIGQEIVVKGNFTFDMPNLTLDNCDIYLDETANVSLGASGNTTSKQLNIKGSTLQGCKTLWRGIKVFPTTSIYLEPNATSKKTLVRDAEKVLDIQRSSSTATTFFKLDGATLEKNMFGVFINDNTCTGCSLLDVNAASTVKGTMFDGTNSELKPPYTGMTAGAYKPKSVAGINVTNCASLTIGVSGATQNTFKLSDFGVYSNKSGVTILNSKFTEIFQRVGGTGMGIYGINLSVIDQTGFGKLGSYSFDNVSQGIYTMNSRFNVKNNNMVNIRTNGVETTSAIAWPASSNTILDNQINTLSNGIYMTNNNVPITVSGNKIVNNTDKNVFGIYCGGTSNTGVKTYNIGTNTIDIKSDPLNTSTYGAGIVTTNAFAPDVHGNTINVNNYTLSLFPPPGANNNNGAYPYIYGVFETNDKSSTFCSNTITGVYTNQGWGIKTANSTGNKYDCNTFSTIGKGLTFLGNCVTIPIPTAAVNNIVDNTFGNHFNGGLYLQSNVNGGGVVNTAQIGKQFHTGNNWSAVGAPNGYAAIYEGPPSITDLTNNQIDVIAGDLSLGNVSPANWFVQSPGTDLTCQAPCTLNQFKVSNTNDIGTISNGVADRGPELLFNEGLYYDIVTGANTMETFSPAYQWMIRRNIYREISDNYGMEIPEEYKAFMESQSNGSVGKFQDFEKTLATMMDTNLDLWSDLLDKETKIEEISKDNAPLIEGFQSLPSDKQALILSDAGHESPMQDLGTLWEERTILYDKLNTLKVNRALELTDWNNQLPVEQVHEKYEQQINAIYLATVVNNQTTLRSNDSTTVDFVAGLCPFEGGFAVYKARAVYSWLYKKYKQEWFECKEDLKPREIEDKKVEKQINPLTFDLMPNPAGDYFNIRLKNDVSNAQFQLIDATGKVLINQNLSGALTKVSTLGFNAGLYWVKITQTDGNLSVQKIIINRL
jgi:hypothetical protein